MSVTSFATTKEIYVKIPSYKVTVNGHVINNQKNKYPLLEYKGITYFPMTYNYAIALKLITNWSEETGFSVSKNVSGLSSELTQELTGNNNLNLTYKATLPDFKIKVNGKEIDNNAEEYSLLVFRHITYFPMTWRFAVNEFGFTTNWDNKEGFSIVVNGARQGANVTAQIGSRMNPFGINQFASITTTYNDGSIINWNASLVDIIRGETAWKMIKEANSFNSPPEQDYELILTKFKAQVTNTSINDIQFDLHNANFTLVSEDGKDYNYYIAVVPNPSLNSKLYKGASNEGWIVFKVKKDDLKPLIVYGKSPNGTGGVWFKGYNENITINKSTNNNLSDQSSDNKLKTAYGILTNAEDLRKYLEDNYSELNTIIGTARFSFDFIENSFVFLPYDYWIQVNYDSNYFDLLKYSNKYSEEQKREVFKQLRDFQEKLAKDIISRSPDKKLYGGYYKSWYRYPNLKVDLITRRYFSWTNYDTPSSPDNNAYNSAKPSTFRWDSSIDDDLYSLP